MTKETMLLQIKRIVQDILGVQLGNDPLEADLTELGMQSVLFIQIVVALEEEFECEIPDSKLLMSNMNTLGKMADAVELALTGDAEG